VSEARSRIHLAPPEFSIPVHDLDASGRDFRLPVRATWIRGVLEGTDVGPALSDGQLDLRLSKSGKDVVVRGMLRAELYVPCARCLDPARVLVREELSTLAVGAETLHRGKRHEDDDDEGSSDGDTLAYDGDVVVLDTLVRDELLLGIPMIPLCSEACPGIRPEVGRGDVGVSVDPRLRPLMGLKKP